MTSENKPAKVPESYRLAVCCQTCPHCLLIKHQDYTESYCNLEQDAPPAFDAREFDRRMRESPHLKDQIDQDEDKAYFSRIDWERDHAVDQWGVCDSHPQLAVQAKPIDPRSVILLNPQQLADLQGFRESDPPSS